MNYAEDLRNVEIPQAELSLEKLYVEIMNAYGIDYGPVIRFYDNDNELLTVVSDDDLWIAVNDFRVSVLYLSDS